MFFTGLAIFSGAALLLAKLRRRWLLKALDHDLAHELWSQQSRWSSTLAPFAGYGRDGCRLMTSVATSTAKRLFGYIRGNVLPGVPTRPVAAPHPSTPRRGIPAGASALYGGLHARHLHRDHRPHHRPHWRQAPPVGPALGRRSRSTPMNAETRRPYRGVNFLTLSIEAQAHAYHRNRWLTYRQAAALSAHVRKGEHGTPVRVLEAAGGRGRRSGQTACHPAAALLHRVQHGADRWPAGRNGGAAARVPKWPSDEVAETLFEASGADIRHGGFGLTTQPGNDYIQMPPAQASPARRATTLRRCTSSCIGRRTRRGWIGSSAGASATTHSRRGTDRRAGLCFLCAHCRIDGQLRHHRLHRQLAARTAQRQAGDLRRWHQGAKRCRLPARPQ